MFFRKQKTLYLKSFEDVLRALQKKISVKKNYQQTKRKSEERDYQSYKQNMLTLFSIVYFHLIKLFYEILYIHLCY